MDLDPARQESRFDPALLGSRFAGGRTAVAEARGLGHRLAQLFEDFYVDLERVRARRGFDPVAALRGAQTPRQLLRVFRHLGDRHSLLAFYRTHSASPGLGLASPTHFDLARPAPLSGASPDGTLQLPIRLERSTDQQQERFWITRTHLSAPPQLTPGVEVTHWNGIPLTLAADLQGRWHRGAHREARKALGLRSLTQRLLGTSCLPMEDWVSLSCRHRGQRSTVELEWQLEGFFDGSQDPSATGSGSKWREPLQETFSGDGFRCGVLPGSRSSGTSTATYVRLFDIPDWLELSAMVDWLATTCSGAADCPLILDLRGNSGGSVDSALHLARLFGATHRSAGTPSAGTLSAWPESARPVRFQFRDTPAVRRMLNQHQEWRAWAKPGLNGYLQPQQLASSNALESLKEVRPLSLGALAILTDALTFSAAEILVAVLRRKRGTIVVGTDHRTGGGTANAWCFDTLRHLHRGSHSALQSLPTGVDLQLAVRRAVQATSDGWVPLTAEPVDRWLPLTARDLFDGNRDLLQRAAELACRQTLRQQSAVA